MSPLAITAVIFALMLALMAVRTPIAVAMFVAGSDGYVAQAGWLPRRGAGSTIPQRGETVCAS